VTSLKWDFQENRFQTWTLEYFKGKGEGRVETSQSNGAWAAS
jgi:hypothetical protein